MSKSLHLAIVCPCCKFFSHFLFSEIRAWSLQSRIPRVPACSDNTAPYTHRWLGIGPNEEAGARLRLVYPCTLRPAYADGCLFTGRIVLVSDLLLSSHPVTACSQCVRPICSHRSQLSGHRRDPSHDCAGMPPLPPPPVLFGRRTRPGAKGRSLFACFVSIFAFYRQAWIVCTEHSSSEPYQKTGLFVLIFLDAVIMWVTKVTSHAHRRVRLLEGSISPHLEEGASQYHMYDVCFRTATDGIDKIYPTPPFCRH